MNQKNMEGTAPAREQLPVHLDVKIYRPSAKGPVLADASVNINGCFAIRGIRVMEGKNGPFVAMPSRKINGEYKDVCFPCTSEFRKVFADTVMDAYHQELKQSMEQAQEQCREQPQDQGQEQVQEHIQEQPQVQAEPAGLAMGGMGMG